MLEFVRNRRLYLLHEDMRVITTIFFFWVWWLSILNVVDSWAHGLYAGLFLQLAVTWGYRHAYVHQQHTFHTKIKFCANESISIFLLWITLARTFWFRRIAGTWVTAMQFAWVHHKQNNWQPHMLPVSDDKEVRHCSVSNDILSKQPSIPRTTYIVSVFYITFISYALNKAHICTYMQYITLIPYARHRYDFLANKSFYIGPSYHWHAGFAHARGDSTQRDSGKMKQNTLANMAHARWTCLQSTMGSHVSFIFRGYKVITHIYV